MLLAIDIGNSRIKTAIFENNSQTVSYSFDHTVLKSSIRNILDQHIQCTDIVVANVGSYAQDELVNIAPAMKWHFISHLTRFPFHNLYKTPTTLGIDRMVLASGAVLSYPGRNRLVIDAGTCVTYDFIDNQNNYHGGAISPGLGMRYRALHEFTAKLPMLERKQPDGKIGQSTPESIHSGVVNGLVHEIDGFIDHYKSKYDDPVVILTGGDTDFLAKSVKNTIFAHSNFLLESLNKTYQFIIKND